MLETYTHSPYSEKWPGNLHGLIMHGRRSLSEWQAGQLKVIWWQEEKKQERERERKKNRQRKRGIQGKRGGGGGGGKRETVISVVVPISL